MTVEKDTSWHVRTGKIQISLRNPKFRSSLSVLPVEMMVHWLSINRPFISLFGPRSDRSDLLAIKVKKEIFTEKVKFEEIIFTNNKDMSV